MRIKVMTDTVAWTEKRLVEIDAETLCRWLSSDMAVLVDVREPWEFAQDRISGAINLPLSKFDIRKLPSDDGRRIVLTCAIGRRSAQAAGIMLATGYDKVTHLRGGMLAWDEADFETLSGEPANDTAPTEITVPSCASA
jgi:rhodanese-related sulfurtransferase